MPAGKTAAFFDVDGTIVDATIVHYYVQFRLHMLSPFLRPFWLAWFIPKVVYYFFLDRVSRTKFNLVFYRNYRGLSVKRVKHLAGEMFDTFLRPKIFPAALDRICEHREQGDLIVLVTGSLDFIIQPLADYLQTNHVLAVQLNERNGEFTGELTTQPLGGEEKALAIKMFANQHGIQLASSYAYGDSRADLPMLRCVGKSVIVNPGKALQRVAVEAGWKIHDWSLEE